MSYDLGLYKTKRTKDDWGEPFEVDRFEEGGTYVLGGSTESELNITYNYAPHYYRELDKDEGIRWLYGKQAGYCIPRLEVAVKKLGTRKSKVDYWKATKGNAGYALNILLQWAKQHPEGYFDGD